MHSGSSSISLLPRPPRVQPCWKSPARRVSRAAVVVAAARKQQRGGTDLAVLRECESASDVAAVFKRSSKSDAVVLACLHTCARLLQQRQTAAQQQQLQALMRTLLAASAARVGRMPVG